MKNKKEKVTVAIRVRPALEREVSAKGTFYSCVGLPQNGEDGEVYVVKKDVPVLVDESGVLLSGENPATLEKFRFDRVFGTSATTAVVYSSVCGGIVKSAMKGRNNTIFAYGQTGSGKTYTMFAGKDAIVDQISAELFSSSSVEVSASFMQIYNRITSDLSATHKSQSLQVQENSETGEILVPGLSKTKIESCGQLNKFIKHCLKNRITIGTRLNSTSSRSHAILTFHLTCRTNETQAKINIVDLAGSERVKDSKVTGNDFRDAVSINTSLLSLARVVRAVNSSLKKPAHIPYRDNPLCTVLKDAIGGNSRTTLIATISPSQRHCQETVSTLKFAAACSRVQNTISYNKLALAPIAQKMKSKKTSRKKTNPTVPWNSVVLGKHNGGRYFTKTSLGNISYLAYGNPVNQAVICLHGSPSCAETWYWLFGALVYSNYYVIAIDMPGCGESSGKELRCRSEYALKKGNAASLVDEVRNILEIENYSLVGYDWGAGIALAMATSKKYRKALNNIIAFHPPAMKDQLADKNLRNIVCPVQIIFSKRDNFHPWNSWKGTAKRMKSMLPKLYKEYIFTERHDETIQLEIIQFLTGKNPISNLKHVYDRPKTIDVNVDGKAVERHSNVVFLEKAKAGHYEPECFEAKDPTIDAVAELRSIVSAKNPANLFQKVISNNTLESCLARELPVIDRDTLLEEPDIFLRYGIWKQFDIPGMRSVHQSPRFPRSTSASESTGLLNSIRRCIFDV